jgi:putative heme-binding domain-containing protein
VHETGVDEIGLNPGAIHALWTLSGLGALGSDTLAAQAAIGALKHPSAAVRRAAAAVLPRTQSSLTALLDGKLLEDSDAQVRLAALLALSEMPGSDAAGAGVLAMLQEARNSEDHWIPDGATSAAARHDVGFLKSALAGLRSSVPENRNAPNPNLIPNPSFEDERDGKPLGWRTVIYSGKAEHALAPTGQSGSRSVMIHSEQGADASWSAPIPVKPRTEYRLSAWIKTENLRRSGAAGRGALLNIHEFQDPEHGATRPLTGDHDWTRVELNFNSGQLAEITVNCLFGGWGQARGTAWFDGIELTPSAGTALPGELGRVVRIVTAHYAERGPVDSIVSILTALKDTSPAIAAPILEGLISGWPEGKAPELAESDKQTLNGLMTSLPESARDRLLALAQRWDRLELFGTNFVTIVESLKKQVGDAALDDGQGAAAAQWLIGLDDKSETIDIVLKQVSLLTAPALATGFVQALAASRNPQTGEALTQHWDQLTPAVRRAAIAALMRRVDWAMALLDAIEKGGIRGTDLATEHWSQLKQNPNRSVAGRAQKLSAVSGAISADREEIVKTLIPLAREPGDAARGKEVFTANCANCHTFNGQGGKIGPDLSGIAARDRTEILLDILDPNRSVEANYRLWNVTTKNGDTFSGRLETETQTSVEILDITAQKHVVQRKDIATLEASQLSIMPTGFEALPREDLKSVLEYLAGAHL